MWWKKSLATLLALGLLAGAVGCGKQPASSNPAPAPSGVTGAATDPSGDGPTEGTEVIGTDGSGGTVVGTRAPSGKKTANKTVSNGGGGQTVTPVTEAPAKDPYTYPLSVVDDESKLRYVIDKDNYRYAISQNMKEYISYHDKARDKFIDIQRGAGQFEIKDEAGNVLFYFEKLKSFKPTKVEGTDGLTVTYLLEGEEAGKATVTGTYAFHDAYVSVSVKVDAKGLSKKASSANSSFTRQMMSGYRQYACSVIPRWEYPADGDAAYQLLDSFTTVHSVGSYSVYTFHPESPASMNYRKDNFPEERVPLSFTTGNAVNYTVAYKLRLDRNGNATDNVADAHSIVKGRNYTLSIRPKNLSDNTAIFTSSKVELSVKVKNLSSKSINSSLKYDIRNYYGEKVVDKSTGSQTIAAGKTAETTISLTAGKKGMYWLQMTANTGNQTAKDYYVFGVTDGYTTKHNDLNPFGMSALPVSLTSPETTVTLLKKLGISNVRVGCFPFGNEAGRTQTIELDKKLKAAGIRINGQVLYWSQPSDPDWYTEQIQENYPLFKDYVGIVEIGNEENMAGSVNMAGQVMTGNGFDEWYRNVFKPARAVVKKTSPNMPIMFNGLAGPDTVWLQKAYDAGIWNQFDVVSLHPYGFGYAPDSKANAGGYWHVETAIKNTVNKVKELGNKPIYITEVGAPVTPGNKQHMDQRTNADYMLRTYAIAMSYGIPVIQWYCLMDQAYGDTFDKDYMEYHFGTVYKPDLNGTVMPKPTALAFANMTALLDGTTKTTEVTSGSSTVRAFNMNRKGRGDIALLWSTTQLNELDTGDSGAKRKAMAPWTNRWTKSETVTYRAAGSSVTVTDVMGNSTTVPVSGGKVTLELTGSPVFVTGLTF